MFAILNGAILMNFHKLYFKNPFYLAVLIIIVGYTILVPKNWFSIVSASCISVYLLIDVFPRTGNHSTIILFASLTILSLFFIKLFRKKELINPIFLSYFFRSLTVTIYFYTGFHKLNTDFLNPCVSCVNEINEYTISSLFGYPFKITDSLSRVFQIATLLIECIVPFGILFHKTIKYSIVILLIFHCYLSLSVFADFSAVGLFLLLGCMINFEENSFSKNTFLMVRIYLAMIIISVLSPFLLNYTNIPKSHYSFVKGCIFLVGYFSFIIYFFKNYSVKRNYFQRNYFLPLLLVCLILSFWTLKSYIGLGNAGNLTMFSNLVTEKSTNNHLLIDTKKTKIFDFEEDAVTIIYLNNKNITENYNGFKLPLVEFRFLVNYWSKTYKDEVPCKLIYKGKVFETKDICNSEFSQTKWWYKYLNFRKIQAKGPNECRW